MSCTFSVSLFAERLLLVSPLSNAFQNGGVALSLLANPSPEFSTALIQED